MVVEDRRDAALQALEHGRLSRGTVLVQIEPAVNRPPLLFEVLEEGRRVAALDCKAAGKSRIDMGVAVHKAGHDEAAIGIGELCLGVCCCKLGCRANGRDRLSLDQDSAIIEIRKPGRTGDRCPLPTSSMDCPFATRRRSATATLTIGGPSPAPPSRLQQALSCAGVPGCPRNALWAHHNRLFVMFSYIFFCSVNGQCPAADTRSFLSIPFGRDSFLNLSAIIQ